MTPFYTTLAIWIGGVVLAALVRAHAVRRPRRSPRDRTVLLARAGLSRAARALLRGGRGRRPRSSPAATSRFSGVQCAHPALFVLACLASSVVYVNLIFSLTAAFGEVGKAAAVVLMVIQVAGSGGTFPPQMLPPAFQALYKWLPFVHSEGALRAAMFGLYGGDYWRELAVLLAYLVPALVLGLVVRRPVIRLGERLEHRPGGHAPHVSRDAALFSAARSSRPWPTITRVISSHGTHWRKSARLTPLKGKIWHIRANERIARRVTGGRSGDRTPVPPVARYTRRVCDE